MATKTVGYRISWQAHSGAHKHADFETLQAARLFLNVCVLDYGYDAKLTPRRKTFNEVCIVFENNGPRKL